MALSGAYGTIKVGSSPSPTTKIAEMSRWTLNLDVNDVDVTNFDTQGWVERIPTFKDWSASCEGNLVPGDNGQKALIDAYMAGNPVYVEFYVGTTEKGSVKISGKAMMTLSMESSVDSQATFSADFRGMGALTVTIVGPA